MHRNKSTAQQKTEIKKILDALPESVLQSVLDYLTLVVLAKTESIQLSNNFRQIIVEDRVLLQKLAQ